jgi:hypothetical protein
MLAVCSGCVNERASNKPMFTTECRKKVTLVLLLLLLLLLLVSRESHMSLRNCIIFDTFFSFFCLSLHSAILSLHSLYNNKEFN